MPHGPAATADPAVLFDLKLVPELFLVPRFSLIICKVSYVLALLGYCEDQMNPYSKIFAQFLVPSNPTRRKNVQNKEARVENAGCRSFPDGAASALPYLQIHSLCCTTELQPHLPNLLFLPQIIQRTLWAPGEPLRCQQVLDVHAENSLRLEAAVCKSLKPVTRDRD